MNLKRYLILFLTLFSAYVTGLLSMEQPERFKRKAPEEEIEPPAKEIKTERTFEIITSDDVKHGPFTESMIRKSEYLSGLLATAERENPGLIGQGIFTIFLPNSLIGPLIESLTQQQLGFEIEQLQITVGPQFTIVSEEDREFQIGKNVLKDVSPYFAHEFETAERGLGREEIEQNRIKIGESAALAFPLLKLMNQQFMIERGALINYDYSQITENSELMFDFFQQAFKWQLDTIGAWIANYIINNIDPEDEQTINNLLTYPIEQLQFIVEKAVPAAENLEVLFKILNHVGLQRTINEKIYKEFAAIIAKNKEAIKQNQKLMTAFATQNTVTENLKKELSRSPIQTIKISDEDINNLHISADGQIVLYSDEIGRNLVVIDRLVQSDKPTFETFENIQKIAYQPYSNLLATIIRFTGTVEQDSLLVDARTMKRQRLMPALNTMAWHPKNNILATVDHNENFSINYIKVFKPGESIFPFDVEQQRVGTLNFDEDMLFAWSSDGNSLIILLDNETVQIRPTTAIGQVLLTKNIWKDILKQEKKEQRIYEIFADSSGNIILGAAPDDDIPKDTYIWNWQSDTLTKLTSSIFGKSEQYIIPIILTDNRLIVFEDHYEMGFIRIINTANQQEIWHLQTPSYFWESLPAQDITANNHYLAYHYGNAINIYLTDLAIMTLPQLINELGS